MAGTCRTLEKSKGVGKKVRENEPMLVIDKIKPSPMIKTVRGGIWLMKSQSIKIQSHMVRGAQINDPIWKGTKIEVMDYNVIIECNEGQVRILGRGGEERSKGRGKEMTALPSRVLGYTTNFTMPEVVTVPELSRWSWSIMPEMGVK